MDLTFGNQSVCVVMNIFALSLDPREAAQFHCDKHVIKMILETAQLLYCSHWVLDPDNLPADAYKKTHPNHPCSIWIRESVENYRWLSDLGLWLCREYTFRYGKRHKTEDHIVWLSDNFPPLPAGDRTPFRMAMPDEYKTDDPVRSYRAYYLGAKERMLVFSKRPLPPFVEKKI
jgi:hypothetical protein